MIPSSLSHLHRTLKHRRGAAAVEFAIAAVPFLFLLFAIIEIGMIFVANINLSNATLALSRQIRVGGVVASGTSVTTSSGATLSLADFKTAICNKLTLVSTATCNAQLQVDIRTLSSFSTMSSATPVSGTNFNTASLCFFSGSAGSIVEFRTYYLWPVMTPMLFYALVNATSYTNGSKTTYGNYFVLVSTEVFKVEQNSAGTNSGSGC